MEDQTEEGTLLSSGQQHQQKATKEAVWNLTRGLIWWGCAALILAFCFGIGRSSFRRLPAVLPASAPMTRFSGARAHGFLSRIVELGVRHSSTSLARRGMEVVANELRSFAAMNPGDVRMEIMVTNHTAAIRDYGAFIDGKPLLAVRLSDGSDAVKQSAVLVDAHIDSQFWSPGACDNGASVATSVEVMRTILAHKTYPWKHAVIFAIGCEEEALEGASSFMDQHPWNNTVRAFVDLECGGQANAPALFFQFTDGWVTSLIKHLPRPSPFVLANDLFKRGITRSTTHYAVYSKRGISGADLAFIGGAEVYHTPHDDLSRVSAKALQHEGDNLLALVAAMATSSGLGTHGKSKPATFNYGLGGAASISVTGEWVLFCFDLAGLFAASWFVFHGVPKSAIAYPSLKMVPVATLFAFLSYGIGLLAAVTVAAIATSTKSLIFFSHPDLFISCCFCAAIIGAVIPSLFFPKVLSLIARGSEHASDPSRLPWLMYIGVMFLQAFAFFVLGLMGFGAAFMPLMELTFGLIATAIGLAAVLFIPRNANVYLRVGCQWVAPVLVAAIPLFFWDSTTLAGMVSMYPPTLSWGDAGSKAGVLVAALSTAIALLASLPFLVMFHLEFTVRPGAEIPGSSRRGFTEIRLFHSWAMVGVVIALFVVLFLPTVAVPSFTAAMPIRAFITHRVVYPQNTAEVALSLGVNYSLSELQHHLNASGVETKACSTFAGSSYKMGTGKGLCFATNAHPNIELPTVDVSATAMAGNPECSSVKVSVKANGGTSRVALLFPWAVSDIRARGSSVNGFDNQFIILYGDARSNDPVDVTFNCCKCAGTAAPLRVDGYDESPILKAVVDKLPAWVLPTGSSRVPGPSSIWTSFAIPK